MSAQHNKRQDNRQDKIKGNTENKRFIGTEYKDFA